jgi:hypothetical protein
MFTGNKEEHTPEEENHNIFENNMKKNESVALKSSSFYTKKKLNRIDKKTFDSNIIENY